MKYLIIKLSDYRNGKLAPIPFGNPNKLKERVSGPWRTTLKTLYETNHALALYKGQVIAAYQLRASVILDRRTHRISFTMDEAKSPLIGKTLDYPTPNPISVLDTKDMKFK